MPSPTPGASHMLGACVLSPGAGPFKQPPRAPPGWPPASSAVNRMRQLGVGRESPSGVSASPWIWFQQDEARRRFCLIFLSVSQRTEMLPVPAPPALCDPNPHDLRHLAQSLLCGQDAPLLKAWRQGAGVERSAALWEGNPDFCKEELPREPWAQVPTGSPRPRPAAPSQPWGLEVRGG